MCDVQSFRAGGCAGDIRTIADWRGDRRVGAGTEWEYRAYDRYCQAVIASHFHAGGVRGNSGCGFDGGYAKAIEGYDVGVDAVVKSVANGVVANGGRSLESRDGSDGCDVERDGGECVGELTGAFAFDCDRRADVVQLESGDVSGGDGDAASVGGCSHDVRCGSSRDGELVSGPADSKVGFSGNVSGIDNCTNVVRGKNYESNRRKRLQRKKNKLRSVESSDWRKRSVDDGCAGAVGQDQSVPTLREFVEARAESEICDERLMALEAKLAEEAAVRGARQTLAEKWSAENKLATLKAEQAYKLLQGKDLELEAKKRSSYARMQHERNMVNTEKAHQYLKVTGNVRGFAQTVVSDEGLTDGSSAPISPGECTISPDSSASMKEFRECQKKLLDAEEKIARYHKMTKIHPDYIDLYKKQTWTINSENIRILDEMYPQGHALNPIPDYENYDAPTHGELIVGRDEEYFPY